MKKAQTSVFCKYSNKKMFHQDPSEELVNTVVIYYEFIYCSDIFYCNICHRDIFGNVFDWGHF